jgi:hypothetical protein
LKRLKPLPWNTGRRKVDAACRALVAVVSGLTDRELEAFISRAKGLTQTNCWWLAYQARSILAEVARNEQDMRRNRKARADAAAAK